MTISGILDTLRDRLRDADLDVADDEIQSTPGRFGAAEIAEESFRTPALRVAFLGARRSKGEANGGWRYQGRFAVFVLTESDYADERSGEGLDLMEQIASLIETARIGEGYGHGVPEGIELEPVYSGEIDRTNVSIHAVAWTQALRLGERAGLADQALDDTQSPKGEGAVPEQTLDRTDLPEAGSPIDITRLPEVI